MISPAMLPLLRQAAAMLFGVAIFALPFCSAKGPPFTDLSHGPALELEGRYRFDPNLRFFSQQQRGELILEKGRGSNPKTHFFMRIFGLNKEGALRLRSYEGRAYRDRGDSGRAELRAERCYLYGKRDWEDRLIPLERWDCEHLFFIYRSSSHFTRRELLLPEEGAESRYTDWFQPAPLIPMPVGFPSLKQKIFFAGQIIEPPERTDPGLVIVWGYQGGRLLRKGQLLTAQDQEGQTVGRLKVVSRPGDFIICRWMEQRAGQDPHIFRQATVAFKRRPPAQESIFGF